MATLTVHLPQDMKNELNQLSGEQNKAVSDILREMWMQLLPAMRTCWCWAATKERRLPPHANSGTGTSQPPLVPGKHSSRPFNPDVANTFFGSA